MTEVAFHTGVDDPLDYACRLLRKAWRQGTRAVVTGEPQALARLDQLLWTFDPGEFLPHARLREGEVPSPELAPTPIWLAEVGARPPAAPVLVNLGPQGPAEIGGWERVIEIVSDDDATRRAARLRWRQYEAAGHRVVHHPKAPAGASAPG